MATDTFTDVSSETSDKSAKRTEAASTSEIEVVRHDSQVENNPSITKKQVNHLKRKRFASETTILRSSVALCFALLVYLMSRRAPPAVPDLKGSKTTGFQGMPSQLGGKGTFVGERDPTVLKSDDQIIDSEQENVEGKVDTVKPLIKQDVPPLEVERYVLAYKLKEKGKEDEPLSLDATARLMNLLIFDVENAIWNSTRKIHSIDGYLLQLNELNKFVMGIFDEYVNMYVLLTMETLRIYKHEKLPKETKVIYGNAAVLYEEFTNSILLSKNVATPLMRLASATSTTTKIFAGYLAAASRRLDDPEALEESLKPLKQMFGQLSKYLYEIGEAFVSVYENIPDLYFCRKETESEIAKLRKQIPDMTQLCSLVDSILNELASQDENLKPFRDIRIFYHNVFYNLSAFSLGLAQVSPLLHDNFDIQLQRTNYMQELYGELEHLESVMSVFENQNPDFERERPIEPVEDEDEDGVSMREFDEDGVSMREFDEDDDEDNFGSDFEHSLEEQNETDEETPQFIVPFS